MEKAQMQIKQSIIIVFTYITAVANAQLQYVPIEIPMPA